MNLVDSSAWIAFFAGTSNADIFKKPIQDFSLLLVPTVVMYEVYKVTLREKGEDSAILIQAHLQQGQVIELNAEIAVLAAELSLKNRLPFADSIILATARVHNAIIWTQDDHFKGLAKVNYYPHV